MTQTTLYLQTNSEPKHPARVFHTWDKWECYPAGFHEVRGPWSHWTEDEYRDAYATFLRSDILFRAALERVLAEWVNSCQHNLTNQNMNRLAWLGQASACISFGLPAAYRGGFYLLTTAEQERANDTALEHLNRWLVKNGGDALTREQAKSKTEANLY